MKSRNYVNMNINPCKMCMPMGGALALKGIEKSMVIMHGSQGCSTYIRRHMAAHYNEPVDIASSSLSEEGTVYGGEANLKKGLSNLIELYNPKVIGVLTTCLAETIGEDIERIVGEYKEEHQQEIEIVPIQTPGYEASQHEGYFKTLKKITETLVQERIPNNKINVIVSEMTCEEIRELKEIIKSFSLDPIIFPDISSTLDAPYNTHYDKLSKEGTKIDDIRLMGGARATIEIGNLVDEKNSPGIYLEDYYGVPLYRLPLPIGLRNTDLLLEALSYLSVKPIPSKYKEQRGRMLDAMIDSHKYNAAGNAAIYGSPELTRSISDLCLENGIKPKIVMTGTCNKKFWRVLEIKLKEANIEGIILEDSDFEMLETLVEEYGINLLIGSSDGKRIREKTGIPMIRVGFPIHDQIGAQRKMYIGYKGSVNLLDEITNTLLEKRNRHYRERMKEEYLLEEVSGV